MRIGRLGSALLILAACGKKPATDTIDAPEIDGAIAADAPVVDAQVVDARIFPDAVASTCTPTSGTNITMKLVAQGLSSPVLATAPVGDARLFVVEQTGGIRIIQNGALLATPFLQLSSHVGGPVNAGDTEQGLLGLAFHPDYAHNGRFYVKYTRSDNALVTAEYTVSADPNQADPTSAREILVVTHTPWKNHNAGTIEFGSDGYLYIGTGDGGGGGGDPGHAGLATTLLGKILRIDVDTRTGNKAYGIPPSNPYASSADGATDPRPEVWSMGWRNPYRWDFDPATGDMIVADVGQAVAEEIDIASAAATHPENFGWHTWEGDSCYTAPCAATGFHMPQVSHTHTDGWCAIIGGAVYRGSCYPDLVGQYFYTDYCKHELWTFTPTAGQAVNDRMVPSPGIPKQPTSIHADALGELYLTSRANGVVFHITAGP